MEIVESIGALREKLGKTSRAFVPTMGNLHAGHLALFERAKRLAPCTVGSIFVNRLQFGAGEDFDRYPRTFAEDCEKLRAAGVDFLFAPSEKTLYPVPQDVMVALPPIADELCGAHRPGHFAGMATVVLKLLNIVQPDFAVFGAKDYQQLHLVRKMVARFDLPVEIVAGETVREADGLAMSSRNRYLDPEERAEAPRLYLELSGIAREIASGNTDFSGLARRAAGSLESRGWRVDYIETRDAETLSPPCGGKRVVLGAARLGKTRLIDNIEA